MLEPLVARSDDDAHTQPPWLFSTPHPSLADLALFYQLAWGAAIAAGDGIADLTGGGTRDTPGACGVAAVWNPQRYPGLTRWHDAVRAHLDALPAMEAVAAGPREVQRVIDAVRACAMDDAIPLVRVHASATATAAGREVREVREWDVKSGLQIGARVSVAPDDTGRDE